MAEIEYERENSPCEDADKIVRQGLHNDNDKLLNDPVTHHSIFAKHEHRIIGGALIYQHSDAVYIDSLWVEEGFRRQGIGRELLLRVEQDALEKGIRKQFISTTSQEAKALYLRLGFECIATVPEYLCGLDKYYLRKCTDTSSTVAVYK